MSAKTAATPWPQDDPDLIIRVTSKMYVTHPATHYDPISVARTARGAKRQIPRDIKPETYLFREGDAATHLYRIVSGVFRLTRSMENGRRQMIAFGYPGDIIGFPAGPKHTTDCESLGSAQVVPYRRALLEDGGGDPVLHRQLLQATLSEINAMQEHFMMLGRKSAGERIASFLCVLADRVGEPLGTFTQVALPMSRADIADFLGLTTETVSRSLTLLRKSKVIAIDRIHTVVVLKPEALLEMALGDD